MIARVLFLLQMVLLARLELYLLMIKQGNRRVSLSSSCWIHASGAPVWAVVFPATTSYSCGRASCHGWDDDDVSSFPTAAVLRYEHEQHHPVWHACMEAPRDQAGYRVWSTDWCGGTPRLVELLPPSNSSRMGYLWRSSCVSPFKNQLHLLGHS